MLGVEKCRGEILDREGGRERGKRGQKKWIVWKMKVLSPLHD